MYEALCAGSVGVYLLVKLASQVLVVERGSPGGARQSWSSCQPSAWGGGEQGDGNGLLHFLLNTLVGDQTYSFNH